MYLYVDIYHIYNCLYIDIYTYGGFPGGTVIRNVPANAGDEDTWVRSWVGKIPWSRKWQPTPVSWHGKFHGQRSLVDYSPWGWTWLSWTWPSDWACTILHMCVRIHIHTHTSGWHLKLGKLASGTTPCHLASPISFSIASAQNTMKVKVEVTQSYVTLCDPMDYRVHGILQARLLEWVAVPFSRGIFPTQGSNPGLLHCRWILYQLSHKVSPKTQ